MTFHELGLSAPILTALTEQGYQQPSPIQEKAIPPALQGRDVLGCAQTGTGKTCAFAAPILQRLSEEPSDGRSIRALILTPTRELAIQIGESIQGYSTHLKLRHTVIFGGVSQNPQVDKLKKGCDSLVATPGRLMDLHNQGFVSLDKLEIFVLDEADRMLDMGFIHDVKKILKWLPQKKQTLFFSATMPPEITNLVNSLLHDPVKVAVDPVSSPVEAIEQSVYMVDRNNKTRLLAHLINTMDVRSALVFTRTKHGANKVARDLEKAGITAAAIHGNKSQTARQQALADFKAGKLRCLVATDIAARGLDIEYLSHVFNYNLPEVPETYVHRIGRTGRAGRDGQAIAFCDFSEQGLLKDVEKLIGRKIPLVEDHPFPMEVFEAPKRDRHGKIVNAEDAEAREAARLLKKARDEARAAQSMAKKAMDTVAEKVASIAAPDKEEPKQKSRRRKNSSARGKVAQQLEAAEQAARKPLEEESSLGDFDPSDYYTPADYKPKMVRPGALLDTGDAMPCTEFERPNPLDSDVIMDATARLLSSRRSVPAYSDRSRSQRSTSENRNRRRRNGDRPQEELKADQERKPRRSGKSHAKAEKPAEAPAAEQASRQEHSRKKQAHKGQQERRNDRPRKEQAHKEQPRKEQNHKERSRKADQQPRKQQGQPAPAQRKNRSGSRRGMPPEPVRTHAKDSTEQPSLMKPYYLDLGR